MNQSAHSSYFLPANHPHPHPVNHPVPDPSASHPTAISSSNPNPNPKRVKCTHPGCGKLFNRKEHLTRHLKSHDSQRQHECPICGRRYARSDVLNRHVEHHSQNSGSSRTSVACRSCRERKIKCDDSVPCRACARNSTECSRVDLGQEKEKENEMRMQMSMRPDIDDVNATSDDMMSGNDQMLTNEIREMNELSASELSTMMSTPDGQTSWIQDPWSLPFSPSTLNAPFPSNPSNPIDLNAADLAHWAMDPGDGGRGHAAVIFSTSSSEHSPFSLPASNGHPLESVSSASPRDADRSDRPASSVTSFASRSPAPSRLSQEDLVTNLQSVLNNGSLATKSLIQLYFVEMHPYWPLLHAPTFDVANTSHLLLGSMVVLSSWLNRELDHMKLAPLVFDAVTAALLDAQPPSLQTLQALLLCVVYSTCCRTEQGMLAKAVHFNGILISKCRQLGVFNGQYAYDDLGDCAFSAWLAQEQLHRLAFSILRVDAHLSILMDHPPSVRYQEIMISLPKSTQLWTAANENERRSLQWNEPGGREKAPFCFLMRDALDLNRRSHLPYRLTEADYHLGLCSLQVGVWEAAREAHICESDELVTNSVSGDPVQIYCAHLELWRVSMENDCQLRQNYFSASTSRADHIFSPLSLTLWHISALTLHAPIKLLEGQGCCFRCRPGADKARLRAWVTSTHARVAVWNAAQISHVVALESSTPTPTTSLLLNPLAIPSLLKSAIVTCSYAYETHACRLCTGGPPIDSVDLFGIKDEDEKLVRWKEQGEGLATWGPGEIPVCRCQLGALETWFREALARYKGTEMELNYFLSGLGKR